MSDYVNPAASGRQEVAAPQAPEAVPGAAAARVAARRRPRLELWLALALIIADQVSKAAIRAYIPLYDSVEVIPGLLNLTHALNTGAAFGFLDRLDFAYKAVVVAVLATSALAAIVFYAITLGSETRLSRLALTLVVAGAIGNLIDRVVAGAVVDFVDFYVGTWHFWAFNVADTCISSGAVLLIFDMLRTGPMFPRLLELGPITLYSYGLLLALGYLAGLRLALIRARARGLSGDRVMDLGIWIIVSALVGAKLLLLYQDWRIFSSDPKQLLSLAQSGGVFYGGLILAVIVALWYIRRHRLPMWTTTDVFAPGIALGHVIGRFGCFLAGCCYGKETTVPWSVVFTDPFALANAGTPLNVHLHPTQLYEAGAEALILAGLLIFEKRGRAFPGRTFWGYMLAYGVSRFVIEFFRGDRGRGLYFGDAVSLAQLISIALVPLSLVMLWWLSRQPAPARDLAPARKLA